MNKCYFNLPEAFKDLKVVAVFNDITVPISNGFCIVPNLKKGNVFLGVYAYKENEDAVTLMYSPKPVAFYVNSGSYTEENQPEEIPEITQFEKYCTLFNNYAEEVLINSETKLKAELSQFVENELQKAIEQLPETEDKNNEIVIPEKKVEGLIAGGQRGMLLMKNSNADYDVVWSTYTLEEIIDSIKTLEKNYDSGEVFSLHKLFNMVGGEI